jgi:hypothetical protein
MAGMKLLVAIIAVAFAITSPALAQSKKKKRASPGIYSSSAAPNAPAQGSFRRNQSPYASGAAAAGDAAIRIEDQNLRYGGSY